MRQTYNHIDLYKELDKTNCRKCLEQTCLAFAAAVVRGDRRLEECPYVDDATKERFGSPQPARAAREEEEERTMAGLRQMVRSVDLAASAERLGAEFNGETLTIKSLGKDFHVDASGNIVSKCHVHEWVTGPLLNYVVSCSGKDPSGSWVPLRELKNGADWGPLFGQRCEKPLKQVADKHTDLFALMVDVFSAKSAPDSFDSDIAVVLSPLPRVPILICYWEPDDGLDSALNLFFDDTAEENLNIESIYALGAGLALMFEKVAESHG